jgi:hypothetical protein
VIRTTSRAWRLRLADGASLRSSGTFRCQPGLPDSWWSIPNFVAKAEQIEGGSALSTIESEWRAGSPPLAQARRMRLKILERRRWVELYTVENERSTEPPTCVLGRRRLEIRELGSEVGECVIATIYMAETKGVDATHSTTLFKDIQSSEHRRWIADWNSLSHTDNSSRRR